MQQIIKEPWGGREGSDSSRCLFTKYRVYLFFTVVPVAASVSVDETEALKAEITKAVEKVQEAGKRSKICSRTVPYYQK